MGQPAFRRDLTARIEKVGGPVAAVWRPIDPFHHRLSRVVDKVEGVHAVAYELTVPSVLGALRVPPTLVDRAGTVHRTATRKVYEGLRTVHWYV